jgi:tricorn protease
LQVLAKVNVMRRGGMGWWMLLVVGSWLGGLVPATAGAQTLLLRYPDIHEGRIVFCHSGNLWICPVEGGVATRLTAHPGQELFPKFSPDGQWIAFTGQYDGDEQVYVMPATGGEPRQLTWYPARGPLKPRGGYDNQVYGWSPDGQKILFRSLQDADGGKVETALYTVNVAGGLPVALPLPTAGAGDFSPDGQKVIYSPLFRDFRTWKRYEGGWAQDLFVADLQSLALRPIAHSRQTERDPMWIGDKIWFVSDRTGTLNLFSHDLGTNETKQWTHSTEADVRWASSDNRRFIVYELLGELVVFDTTTGQERRLQVQVPDDGLDKRPSRIAVDKFIESFDLSPKGERALFVARGDVFSAPIEKGLTRNLTNSSRSHERAAAWSPDGAKIAFVSDKSGEEQVYVVPQDGSGPAEALTAGLESMLFALKWSPDGKRLSFSDKFGRLHVLTLADKTLLQVADERRGLLQDYEWSPCGGHIALRLSNPSELDSLFVYTLADRQLRRVTSEYFDVTSPTWDPKGDYLFFLSRRQFAPQLSSLEWNYAGNRGTGIFALALRKDVKPLFPPESDEVQIAGAAKPDSKPAEAPPADRPALVIDFDGLDQRVMRIPVEADNISGLVAIRGHLLYSVSGARFYGREGGQKTRLQIFDLAKREASTLLDDVGGYAVSADGAKVLARTGTSFTLIDARPKGAEKKTVSTKDLAADRVPADEFAAIFDEVWRRYRDFFYVRNMHGYDWKAIGDRYRKLLPHVAHRSDLNYILGEMIAELNAGHCYIEGGDFDLPERARVGLPGARFTLDPASGRYRIAKILRGENEEEKYRSPLTEVGVDIAEGDYVLAIDGQELKGTDSPYRLLRHKAQLVTLTVSKQADGANPRQVSYRPIFAEENLLYLDWVRGNRERVAKATDGRVGYLHIPDMGADGIYEFIKWYYPQVRKEGLVIDVRSNGGGNVSQMILERLDNRLLGTRFGSLNDDPGTYPGTVFHGHMVCLVNEVSASDGDIFPHRFRQAGLGPLIGRRTWGGVVGISNIGPLLDGGTVFVPLQATNSPTGEYIIEGEGVSPDIDVVNEPKDVIAGKDAQLERGIAEVLERMTKEPRRLPQRPADPNKAAQPPKP